MIHSSGPDRDGVTLIHIASDEMLATVDLYPHQGSGKPLELDTVEYALLNEGVTNGIDRESLFEGLSRAEGTGEPVKGVTAARGVPPVNTVPKHFEFPFPAAAHSGTEVKVDYREFASIPIVRKNDILARQIFREEGKPGLTVKGREIPFRDAADQELEAGENVAVLGNGTYVARDDGRLIQEKGRVRVESALIVENDVDFSTGNIRFPKDVVVKGNVLDDFVIETNGNLLVKGIVGAATLSAKGSIEILGGFTGKGRGIIRAGGGAKIAYIDNGTLFCLGDLLVASEIVNSTVRSNGKVTCIGKKGTIIGGSASARGGIECSTAGSERGHATRLEVGIDVMVASRLEKAEGLMKRLSERIAAVGFSLEEAVKGGRTAPSLEKERKELLKKLNELAVDREGLQAALHGREGSSITIRTRVHPGVVISIFGVERSITTELGPSSFALDAEKTHVVSDRQAKPGGVGESTGREAGRHETPRHETPRREPPHRDPGREPGGPD